MRLNERESNPGTNDRASRPRLRYRWHYLAGHRWQLSRARPGTLDTNRKEPAKEKRMKTQVILKNLQWLGRHNPAFTPGSVQTAVAELLNPTSSILPYSARLCLNKPGMLCTGKVFFNIEAGKTKNIYFSTEVPTVEGTYPVYLDIFSNDQLLEAYRAAEDIIIGIAVEYTLEVTIEPPGAGYVTKSPSKATYSAGEKVTLTAHPYSGYEFDHWGGWPPYPGVGSTSPTIQITMDADWWVVAAFRKVALKQCPLSVSASPSSGGSVRRSPSKALYDDGEMIDVTATANSGWSFDKFTGIRPDGSTWESTANPVHPRGCRTTSVTAHFIKEAAPPLPEPVMKYHYRVTFTDGTTRIISWVPDPVSKPNLWDFVDKDKVVSWTYLGLY